MKITEKGAYLKKRSADDFDSDLKMLGQVSETYPIGMSEMQTNFLKHPF